MTTTPTLGKHDRDPRQLLLERYHEHNAGNLQTRLPLRVRDFLNNLAKYKYPSREAMALSALERFLAERSSMLRAEEIWQARATSPESVWVQYTISVPPALATQIRDEAMRLNISVASYLVTALNWLCLLPEHAKYFKSGA